MNIELPRPPNDSGAFLGQSQWIDFKNKKINPLWKPTIEINKEYLIALFDQIDNNKINYIKLWAILWHMICLQSYFNGLKKLNL